MKPQRLTILVLAAFLSVALHGQMFTPLGLGIETSEQMVADFQPQIHVEGDILCACTRLGLYSKDLSDEGSAWQLVGFEGIPILDYVRRGDDIIALCFNDQNDIFLLSHDGGKTFEDITPEEFMGYINNWGHLFWRFDQHPTDPNTFLLTSFVSAGIFQTTDFGQTWTRLSPYTPDYVGFHPLNPEIIYESGGGGFTDEKTDLRISYDGGQTWEGKTNCFPNYNAVFRMAFHPTNPNRWIAGGNACVHSTNDNGQTWETQSLRDYNNSPNDTYLGPWRYAAYDTENPDIVYMAGGRYGEYMKLMCSTDGGTTWNRPYLEPIKMTPKETVFDLRQYGDKLLIYSQSDVYAVSKAELIAETSEPVAKDIEINETTFPDPIFRGWVLNQWYGSDGVLTEAEIGKVRYVTIDRNDTQGLIQNLKGIEYFTALVSLYCIGQQLTELNVPKDRLIFLYCGENQLKTLDVSGCPLLGELSCEDNQLTTLNVTGCPELVELWCPNNLLDELDVTGCPNLIELGCYQNKIKGNAMNTLVESLPPVSIGRMHVLWYEGEQNEMTKSQVAAAKSKGWIPDYYDGQKVQDYEGSDDSIAPVYFATGQMATIILPTEPDAEKGKYYRLDRCEKGQIIFEQELQPQARVPYIIVPDEDFSIDPITLDLTGLSRDTVAIEGISFIGSYVRTELPASTGGEGSSSYIDIIDLTPDCGLLPSEETGQEAFLIGALRAYLDVDWAKVHWDDPYSQTDPKGVRNKLEIVLLDYGTGIDEIQNSNFKIQNGEGSAIYDLSGRKWSMVNGQRSMPKGIYIKDRKKVAVK